MQTFLFLDNVSILFYHFVQVHVGVLRYILLRKNGEVVECHYMNYMYDFVAGLELTNKVIV